MEKELQGLAEVYTRTYEEQHSRKHQIGKHRAIMEYTNLGLKNPSPSTAN